MTSKLHVLHFKFSFKHYKSLGHLNTTFVLWTRWLFTFKLLVIIHNQQNTNNIFLPLKMNKAFWHTSFFMFKVQYFHSLNTR